MAYRCVKLTSLCADVDPKPSSPLQTMYNLLANVPHESTIASTSSAGVGPGVSQKKKDKVEDDTTWKVCIDDKLLFEPSLIHMLHRSI